MIRAEGMEPILDGKYRLGPRIDAGGMGEVLEGHDLSLNRPVAIKFLHTRYKSDPELVARFRREAEALASVEHPRIVPVYAIGEHEGRPYFVMKRLYGRTLSEMIREEGRLSLAQVVHTGVQVLEALDRLHGAGLVHRDIKPGNIMIEADGGAVLLDFGILRSEESGLTATGAMVGTPEFMAPEQARDARLAEPRSDLYSVAATIYNALTGAPPFRGSSMYEIVHKHHVETPLAPSTYAPELSREVDELVLRALAKSPDDRYASAREMSEELAALRSAPRGWSPEGDPQELQFSTMPTEAGTTLDRRRRRFFYAVPIALVATTGALAWLSSERELIVEARVLEAPVERSVEAQVLADVPSPIPLPVPVPIAEEGARGPPARKPMKARPARTATLRVVTLDRGEASWARIQVDGKTIGTSPIASHTLAPGEHTIVAERDGYGRTEIEVRIAEGESKKVILQLERDAP